MKRLAFALTIALALWFYMFSPWTGGFANFWINMSCAAIILSCTAIWAGSRKPWDIFKMDYKEAVFQIAIGIAVAAALWGVFWVGDKLSQLLFDFARPQVDNVYGMKEGMSPTLVGLLLLFLIGPAEEFFWRGYVQDTFAKGRLGSFVAFALTTGIYCLAHLWSFNFMLIMAALIAGAVWGFLYWIKPSWLPALIVSHALWDAMVFVVFPI